MNQNHYLCWKCMKEHDGDACPRCTERLTMADLRQLRKLCVLMRKCPPTVRQVVNAGNEAVGAAGLNPYCMNEGANGDDKIAMDGLRELEEKIENLILTDLQKVI